MATILNILKYMGADIPELTHKVPLSKASAGPLHHTPGGCSRTYFSLRDPRVETDVFSLSASASCECLDRYLKEVKGRSEFDALQRMLTYEFKRKMSEFRIFFAKKSIKKTPALEKEVLDLMRTFLKEVAPPSKELTPFAFSVYDSMATLYKQTIRQNEKALQGEDVKANARERFFTAWAYSRSGAVKAMGNITSRYATKIPGRKEELWGSLLFPSAVQDSLDQHLVSTPHENIIKAVNECASERIGYVNLNQVSMVKFNPADFPGATNIHDLGKRVWAQEKSKLISQVESEVKTELDKVKPVDEQQMLVSLDDYRLSNLKGTLGVFSKASWDYMAALRVQTGNGNVLVMPKVDWDLLVTDSNFKPLLTEDYAEVTKLNENQITFAVEFTSNGTMKAPEAVKAALAL